MARARTSRRRGVQAASASAIPDATSVVYGPPFVANTVPAGVVAVPTAANAPSTVTVDASGRMREGNTGGVDGTYFTLAVFPETMAAGPYKVGAGQAAIQVSDRGVGAGYCNSDLNKAVFVIMCGNTTPCRLYTFVGGVVAPVGSSQAIFSTAGSDVIWIQYSLSGADIVYTVMRNATATTVTWTDTNGATIGTPGRKPCLAFRRTRSGGGAFASPGIDSIEAVMI